MTTTGYYYCPLIHGSVLLTISQLCLLLKLAPAVFVLATEQAIGALADIPLAAEGASVTRLHLL